MSFMIKQISQIGLISVTLLGMVNLPSLAQTTTSQTGSLDATVNGDNNQVDQTINQTIIYQNNPGMGTIRRNQNNGKKTPKSDVRSSSHQHSEDREHPRKNDR